MWFPFESDSLDTTHRTCGDWVELRYLGKRHKDNGHRLCYRSDFLKYESRNKPLFSSENIVRVLFEAPDRPRDSPDDGFRMCFRRSKCDHISCKLYLSWATSHGDLASQDHLASLCEVVLRCEVGL